MKTFAKAGLVLSMSIVGACSGQTARHETPKTTGSFPEITIDALNKRLGDVRQFIGPIAVNWISCPPGGTKLSPDMRVNAFVFDNGAIGKRADGEPKLYHTVEIGDVHEYRDSTGNVAAWCGKNIVKQTGHPEIQGTETSGIIVIPVQSDCPQPKAGQAIPCGGMPLLYDNGPNNTPGTIYLDPTPPTNPTTIASI